jgi:hypothetical protein
MRIVEHLAIQYARRLFHEPVFERTVLNRTIPVRRKYGTRKGSVCEVVDVRTACLDTRRLMHINKTTLKQKILFFFLLFNHTTQKVLTRHISRCTVFLSLKIFNWLSKLFVFLNGMQLYLSSMTRQCLEHT